MTEAAYRSFSSIDRATMTPRTSRSAARVDLDPAHVPGQLAQCSVWSAVELELEHEEVANVVHGEDIDRSDCGPVFPAIAVSVCVQAEVGSADLNLLNVLNDEVAKVGLESKRYEIGVGRLVVIGAASDYRVARIFIRWLSTQQTLVQSLLIQIRLATPLSQFCVASGPILRDKLVHDAAALEQLDETALLGPMPLPPDLGVNDHRADVVCLGLKTVGSGESECVS